VLKKIAVVAAGVFLALTLSLELGVATAHAAKVDCDAVMNELNSGKKAKEVASDLKISKSSVYKCKKKAATSAATPAAPAPK
jgi:hypothetical protein